jgi:hypothetical protein
MTAVRRAVLDERLGVKIVSQRLLRYTRPAAPVEDRPDHVRAASGIAVLDDTLFVIQDDASFIAVVTGDEVDAIPLPPGPNDRRRFEKALGNKLDKLDFEACLVDSGELLVFGSGSLERVRDVICRVRGTEVALLDARALYAELRAAIGGMLNVEGAVRVADELWLFHRGNTGPADPGPAVVRVAFAELRPYLDGGAPPAIRGVDRYELGEHAGVRYGFTAAAARGDRVFVVFATEASPDAIEDGAVGGARLGVIEPDTVRFTELRGTDGCPCKVEGLAFDPHRADRAWITIDRDDPEEPAPMCEVVLVGPW